MYFMYLIVAQQVGPYGVQSNIFLGCLGISNIPCVFWAYL